MIILSGSNSKSLTEKISSQTGIPMAKVLLKKFPDGESYVLIDEDVTNQDILIVQSMYPNQNDSLVETMLLSSTLVDLGAKNIISVMPYLAYSRQHKIYQKGEPYSLKNIISSLKHSGMTRIITVDTHFHRKPEKFDFFGMEFINLSAGKILLDNIRENVISDFIVIGPDFGSSEIIEFAIGKRIVMKKEEICPDCKKQKTECRCEDKERKYEVSGFEIGMDLKNKNVVILDDMITSGTTMINAVEKVRNEGAKMVIAAATHGLFLKDSLKILQEKTDYLVVTDSVESSVSKVSIAPLISEVL